MSTVNCRLETLTKRRLFQLVVMIGLTATWIACVRQATRPVTTQVVVLGFDGADPGLLSDWMKEGQLPNLARLAQMGTFRPLRTTNPPESPVAWRHSPRA